MMAREVNYLGDSAGINYFSPALKSGLTLLIQNNPKWSFFLSYHRVHDTSYNLAFHSFNQN